MLRVKICGIKTLADAQAAIDAGADLLGFNFYPKSKRYISPDDCGRICEALEVDYPHIIRVGVFVNATLDEIQATLRLARLNLAQLHGDEPLSLLAALGDHAFKAVRLPDNPDPVVLKEVLQFARRLPGNIPGLLVDAAVPGAYGGTGSLADWSAAEELARHTSLLLAGGLTPENVAAAVRQVHPWGVDTASGVEIEPGEKDAGKMQVFIRAARTEIG